LAKHPRFSPRNTVQPTQGASAGVIKVLGFHTCALNREVEPFHPKAMPVILVRPEQWRLWLTAPIDGALHLQHPLSWLSCWRVRVMALH